MAIWRISVQKPCTENPWEKRAVSARETAKQKAEKEMCSLSFLPVMKTDRAIVKLVVARAKVSIIVSVPYNETDCISQKKEKSKRILICADCICTPDIDFSCVVF